MASMLRFASRSVAAALVWSAAGAPAYATETHGLSQKAVEIARPLGFPITNSMVVTWVVAAALIAFAQAATRHMRQVPAGAQNLLEWLAPGGFTLLARDTARAT